MIYNELKAGIDHRIFKGINLTRARSVFDDLDTEAISDIILDENSRRCWFEYSSTAEISNHNHDWLKAYLERRGYTYLYQ